MFEPRHNILSNVRANVRKYVATWFEHSPESNRPVPGPILADYTRSVPVMFRWPNVTLPRGQSQCGGEFPVSMGTSCRTGRHLATSQIGGVQGYHGFLIAKLRVTRLRISRIVAYLQRSTTSGFNS